MKIHKYLRISLMSLLFLITTYSVKAQNYCTTADTLSGNYCSEYQFKGSKYYWIKFTAENLKYFFNILQPINTPAANVTDIFLYGDSCNNLSLITSQSILQFDSLRIFSGSLIQGAKYYICVKQDTTINNYFRLAVEKLFHKSWIPDSCPPAQNCSAGSELISNGIFYPDTIPYPQINPFLTQSDSGGVVCGWQAGRGTPNLQTGPCPGYPTIAAGDYAAHMWASSGNSESIFHDFNFGVPQQGGEYSLGFKYATNDSVKLNVVLTNDIIPYVFNSYDPYDFTIGAGSYLYLINNETINYTNLNWVQRTICFSNLSDTYARICIFPENKSDGISRGITIDNISLVKHSFEIITLNDTLCNPDTTNINTAPCPAVGNDQGITWHFLWSNGDTTQNITVYPQVTTTYTVTASNSCGYSFADTVTITIIEVLKPEISGSFNTCDTNAIYTIENAQPGYSYFWEIGDGSYSNSFPQWGSTISVVWEPLWGTEADHTWIYVTTDDSVSGCNSYDSIRIWKCCRKSAQTHAISDTTITDSTLFIINSYPSYFNGTIIVNANISESNNSEIYMGPEAKFVVNPPYTFTLKHCKIQAGCPYMWNGIYVTDSNAKVVIQDTSWVQDGLNSVYSENGGKFELKNSSFYNNYTSVLVRNNFYGIGGPTYSHKGKIYGCLFDIDGTGNIAPYLGDKPRHGIRLENVYNITVGDSTQDSNRFRNIFCGIAGFNSSVNVYNNQFYYINPPSACYSPTGDFYNLNCETAVHCTALTLDAYHITSRLTCGAGVNSGNTFDTCQNAIYTYNTQTFVNYATVLRCHTGIYGREARTTSYVNNSSFKTNIADGIKFINILPVYKKITVKYDSILDPIMGVQLMNIRSSPTMWAYQTKVSNNYITLDRSYPVNGISIEKCDYVEAYCNMIHRASLPPSSHQLFIRGIAIDQSLNAQIHDNTSETIGVSIKGRGSLLGTQFKCNTSDGSYNGFYFNDIYPNPNTQTALSDQGNSSLPNDNTWYNDVVSYYRIDGTYTGVTANWFYRGMSPEYIPNEPLSLYSFIPLILAQNPVAVNCQSCTYGTMMAGNSNQLEENQFSSSSSSGINNTELTAIMNESNSYDQLDESFKYFEKQYAYQKLEENQQSLTTAQSNYFNALKNSNIGKFEQIYRDIEDNNIINAITLNNQISPISTIEIYRKWVNNIYFDYIIPQKAIPQNIIADLETLASSSPFVNGDAVYSARAIVDYTEPEAIVKPKSLRQDNQGKDIINKHDIIVNVYPNPAENNINVNIKGLNGDLCKFTLRNLLGSKLIEKDVKADGFTLTINIEKLINGLFLYEVLNVEGVNIKSGRLVINK